MADKALLNSLRDRMALKFQHLSLPSPKKIGLVVIDAVNGFCSVGMGNLAPTAPNAQIDNMIEETNRLAKRFSELALPIFVFLDAHEKDRPEPPYPPHCIIGTGEEKLVPSLRWLENDKNVTLLQKDCINGFIGAIRHDGTNAFIDWVIFHNVEQVLVVGVCTDICVMDFVLTVLSARNHGILGKLTDVFVYSDACATYDLPRDIAVTLNRGIESSHPQEPTHHLGLYFMHSRGAVLVNKLCFDS